MHSSPASRVSKLPLMRTVFLLVVSALLCSFLGAGSVGAQQGDDHGNFLNTATALPLDSTVAGRIDPGDDRDIFKLDLSGTSGATHIWIYTTGSLDTVGGLYDSTGGPIASNDDTTIGGVTETNFRLPGTLVPGVYYVGVFSAGDTTTGEYILHAKSDDHSSFFSTATTLPLDSSVAGRIDPGHDEDVFKLDLSGASGTSHVWIYTTGSLDTWGVLYDSTGSPIDSNNDTTISGVTEINFRLPETLVPGVYYVGVFSADDTTTGEYILHAKSDDHSSFFSTATALPLDSSVAGHIDPGNDRDVFKLDLSGTSGTTDVWIYTTGDLDTLAWLYDDNGEDLLVFNNDGFIDGGETNFHLRRRLSSGIYYVSVRGWGGETGDYTLHAEAVTDPGSTTGTATLLNLDSPSPGTIGTSSDGDYFRLVLAESKNLVIYARGLILFDSDGLLPIFPLDSAVFDNSGTEISVNMRPQAYGGYGGGVRIADDFGPGTYYIIVTAPASDTTYPVPYTIHAYEDADYTNFIDDCEAATASLNNSQTTDPLYGCQWHLNNGEGEDINVEAVWAEGLHGAGINIAVVDDTIDYSHEDLTTNVNATLNHDYGGRSGAFRPFDHHGTAVAGVIAAQNNGDGVRGVAPRATIYGYNLLSGASQQILDMYTADAMTRNRAVTAISNNSWGPIDAPWLGEANRLWELAVDSGVSGGYNGKGVFYVFPGGNGGRGHLEYTDGTLVGGHIYNSIGRGDNSNLDEIANYYAVTAVCAVNDADTRSAYSEKGANLWVCAPSLGDYGEHRGIVTTENSDRYQDEFGGTSASTPIVSGVAALLREANPDLTWRDLKLVLAASARKNDATNSGWEDGARKYGAGFASDRYHFNHEYGFGVVDAKAAVDLARGWTNAPTLENVSAASRLATTIPPPLSSGPRTVTTTLTLNTGIRFTEFVEINADFDHTSFRDMDIELVSPSGAVSKLAVPFNTRHYYEPYNHPTLGPIQIPYYVLLDGEFRFGSARHLGEDPNGVWTLRLTDHFPELGGILRSWSIKVYGHVSRPGAPTISTPITAGLNSLNVAWSAPSDNGGPAVSAYDLRYILTSDDDTMDDNWTVVEDIWTTGPDPLEYTLAELSGGTQYDVQVRAVSSAGDGVWSATATGTPAQALMSACSTGVALSAVAANPGLVSDCDMLLAALDILAGSGLLNWSGNTAITSWDGVTIDGSPLRVTKLELRDNQLTGTLPPELAGLTNLETLSLTRNQLTGMIPSELENLTSLSTLALGENQLNGEIPAQLGNLINLRALSLGENQLTGDIPPELGSLARLEVLWLSNNRLSGEIPSELGNLANLAHLRLEGNQLSGAIPAELGRLANLTLLYLFGNQLTGCVPASLRDVADNDFVQLMLGFCTTDDTLITSGPEGDVTYEENGTDAVGTYTASRTGVAWALTGDDAEDFNISGGVLTFGTSPDYEAPTDANTDNVYEVTVVATVDAITAERDVRVTVTDDAEEGPVARYDNNPKDGVISISELFDAIDDYFDGDISISELFDVIDAYFG